MGFVGSALVPIIMRSVMATCMCCERVSPLLIYEAVQSVGWSEKTVLYTRRSGD